MDVLIIWLMVVNLMSQSAFSLLAPFYPDMAEKKGLSSTIVGLVMASFSLSFVVTSFFVGMKISKLGRRFILFLGIILQGISMVGFGCIIWVNNKALFIILSFGFRLLGGVAWAFICVAAYAMVSIKYPDDVQSKISLLEAANGAGLFCGPIFGGIVYQFTHFCVPFFMFTAIFYLCIPFMKKSMTEELDRDDNKDNLTERLGYFKLLRHKRVAFAALTQFFNIIMFTSGQPIIGPRLTDSYNFKTFLVGVAFAIPTVAYIVTGLLLLPIITKKFETRATMMWGFFILVFSGYFIGPSKLLGFPDESVALMMIGLWVLGMGAAFTVIPVIPEMLDAVDGQYEEHKSEISDNFSGIFNVAGGFGQIVGPSIAGALSDKVGFNWTFDTISTTILAYTIIYIIFCGGIGSIGRSFKATMLRFKKGNTEEETDSITSSPKRHLLNSDAENEDHSGSDEEESQDFDKEVPINKSNDISTDISVGAIN